MFNSMILFTVIFDTIVLIIELDLHELYNIQLKVYNYINVL